jgi:hypothetical protein
MMPVVVIVFALLWGWMAGLWLDRAEGCAGSARE